VASEPSEAASQAGSKGVVLLGSVFAVAAAGLVYELVAGTLSTYLLGGSVLVFSLVIGWFLFAMGAGAYAAKYVEDELFAAFVAAEIALALVGGLSAVALFTAFAAVGSGYPVALAVVVGATGALVGVEIPLLLRIVEERVSSVRVAVSHVLALDYAGALLGSVAFPLVLLPWLGVVRASALLGLMNLAVAAATLAAFGGEIRGVRRLWSATSVVGVVLTVVMATGGRATTWLEDTLYDDEIVFAESTSYQRVVVTRWREDLRLFLDGHLQFSTVDEHRYHEALVHPALGAVGSPESVLILGGGDGLAARRVLDHPTVRRVDLVDLDPDLVALFRDHPALSVLSGNALTDPRLTVHHDDAVRFLETSTDRWDAILIDLPDPNDAQLARLYAESTYQLALRRLTDRGALVTHATSPFHAPDAFWCIVATLESAVAQDPVPRDVFPYHAHVPSFGEWGWVVAIPRGVDPRTVDLPDTARFLDADALSAMFAFPRDLERRDVRVNRLGDPVLADYYRRGWRAYAE
jgi:spermidine synthase